MTLRILEDYNTLSEAAAREIVAAVMAKPTSVLCLAAGETPRLAYALLPRIAAEEKADFSSCTFVGLDEWAGIRPENEGSCFYFLKHNLFDPLGLPRRRIHVFDGLAANPTQECERINAVVRVIGGIDLMLVGVGMNGHIGFNEPGVSETLRAHVADLDETTRTVGQKYFRKSTLLQKGLTLGLRDLLESRRTVMIASGRKKAAIMWQALEGPVTTDIPASVIRQHPNALALLDRDAASSLTI